MARGRAIGDGKGLLYLALAAQQSGVGIMSGWAALAVSYSAQPIIRRGA